MKAISAKKLSKTYWFYEKKAGLSGSIKTLFQSEKIFVQAVREIDMDIDVGEIVGFIGPNGAGKTTTLKMLSGILHPTEGEVAVMGHIPFKREKAFLRNIAFITGQRNRLFWDLPAEEYFEFCRVVYEIPKELYRRSIEKLVGLAEIGGILKVPQRKLSFGQRKRCELVAALLHDPKVIFLDEPTNAMDLINARRVREFIKGLGDQGEHTVLLTSHNMSDIEQVCDRIIVVDEGRIIFDGSVHEMGDINGSRRQIRVLFGGPWAKDEVEKLGEIHSMHDHEVCIEVDRENAAEVVSHLFASLPVKDISIAEPRLETIIASLYERRNI